MVEVGQPKHETRRIVSAEQSEPQMHSWWYRGIEVVQPSVVRHNWFFVFVFPAPCRPPWAVMIDVFRCSDRWIRHSGMLLYFDVCLWIWEIPSVSAVWCSASATDEGRRRCRALLLGPALQAFVGGELGMSSAFMFPPGVCMMSLTCV